MNNKEKPYIEVSMVNKNNQNSNEKWSPDVCNYRHESVDTQFDGLKDSMSEMKQMIKDLQAKQEKAEESLKNQIKTTELNIDNKIGKVNEAVKGNGKIGLEEKVKNTTWMARIALALILLIIGGKIWGLTLDEMISVFKKPAAVIEVVEPNKTSPNDVKLVMPQSEPIKIESPKEVNAPKINKELPQ